MIRFMEGVLISKCSVHLQRRPAAKSIEKAASWTGKGQGAAESMIIRM